MASLETTSESLFVVVVGRAGGLPCWCERVFSISLNVTPATLIPRPETEGLVVRALDVWKQEFSSKVGMRVLDVGTGSGALAIALATHMKDAIVAATDISQPALDIASINVSKHSLETQISLFRSDLLDHPSLVGPWDIIVSNPPYIREDEFDGLPDDIRIYEPREAACGRCNRVRNSSTTGRAGVRMPVIEWLDVS